MEKAWERREMHTEFGYENLKERQKLQDPDVDKRII
jgi:hypothetical protein